MYLKLKGSNGYIPLGIFTDLDIYQYEPHELSVYFSCQGLLKNIGMDIYFFTLPKKKFGNGNKLERNLQSAEKGHWKSTQTRKDIVKNNNTIGTKKSLVYFESSPNNSKGKKTSRLMSDYRFPTNSPLLINEKNDNENDDDNDQIFNHSSWSDEHSSLQQYQSLINSTDNCIHFNHATKFFHGYDLNICPYLNYDNFTYIGDEKIGDTSNSNIVDSQDDQRPSTDNQDYDHKKLKMKKIKR
ncbi:hypothetical protein R3W88_001026 [Solanum pinnatisectum]|uniref:NAC domain-containing protein n=1 Tax=Solanum pinnatisectum TaxID=50273 RepID=A0AAV9MK07_9SOLN|nr:hypothetical protein R3W88_001026 [Solanum pinnatisectum]